MSSRSQKGGRPTVAHTLATDGRSLTGRSTKRSRTVMVGGLALGLTSAALAGMPAQAIDSSPPSGPGNIEVFPKRDMVAIEGYTEYAGKDAVITVTRGNQVIGSAKGKVDGTGFLEVNHPGGVCWGAGAPTLQVTPNIKGGDQVKVEFLGTGTPNKWDGITTRDIEIKDVIRDDDGHKLIVQGRFGADVDMPGADLVADPGKALVEIVNPDMRGGTSAIGERAISWPIEAGEVAVGFGVTGGVTSGAEGSGGTFEVVFDFESATDLDLAEAGEVVGLAWMADAPPELGIEFQAGATLYEFHEASGPGMGGCPAGPQEQRPNSPTEYTAKGAGPGKIDVTWGKGTTLPAAPEISGYEIIAVRSVTETGVDAGGVVRTGADGASATVENLTAGEIFDVEIASRSEAGNSKPAVVRVKAADHIVPTAEANTLRVPKDGKYAPLVDNGTTDFGVHLDPVPGLLDAEVHYTVDGSTPTLQSPTFVPGDSASLKITQDTTVKWIVVDSGNVVGPKGEKFFDIVETTNPAPENVKAAVTPVNGALDVTFNRLTDPTVTSYRVQAYDETGKVRIGTPLSVAQPTSGDTVLRRMPNLTNGTKYTFTVAARYGNVWSNESAHSLPVAPAAAAKADAGPDQTVLRGRTFDLDGGNSPRATSYKWTQVRPAAAANGGLPQDPQLDLDPVARGTQSTTVAGENSMLTLRAPLMTGPISDHNLQFRLTTTHEDGTTKNDLVDITLQADTVVVEEARWRAGDEIGGTGSQDGANLTITSGPLPNGLPVGVAVVGGAGTPNEWEYPGGTPAAISGKLYMWSDYGFSQAITVTN
jgi:hypothetical protein